MATPKLIILSAQYRGKQFELTGDLHTAGRVEERDICISDSTVSTHHCDFIRTGSTYTVRDNNSTNGTRVNNVPITEQELHNSDIIQIGGVEVLYDSDEKTASTTQQKTQTGIIITDLESNSSALRRAATAAPVQMADSSRKQKIIMLSLIGLMLLLILVLGGVLVFGFL